MKDEFNNRLSMFQTALGVLNSPEHQPTWQNQPPTIFTTKAADAQTAYDDLVAFTTSYAAATTGAAADKEREERELEDEAYSLGSMLVCWFRDRGDETNAAQVDRPISKWRRLRGNDLIAQATITRDLANDVATGPDATDAAAYDITPATVQALSDELADYEAVITAPQQSIAGHKAKRLQLRDRFREVEAKFDAVDTMIVRFDKTEAGRNLIAAYKAARIIRDLGHGPGTGGGNGDELPTALEIDQLTRSGANVDVSYIAGGGSGADTLHLRWQVDGVDPGFDNFTDVVQPQQSIGPFNPGDLIRFKTVAGNIQGETESAMHEITLS